MLKTIVMMGSMITAATIRGVMRYCVGLTANVLSAQDKTDLQTRIAEQIGTAESELGQAITADDVSACLQADRPNGVIGGPA